MTDDPNLSKTWIPADSGSLDDSAHTPATVPRMQNTPEEPIPENIGRYAVESVLGTGGYGRVYLAKDTELQRRVALKVPHLFAMDRADAIERFLAEAQTVASLDHPGVVPIYDFGRWEDRCFVVSKFIDGETLYQRRQRSPLTISEVAKLIRTIAGTLGYIHSCGVVHRDIKPGNLLVDEVGRCFVTDFGLALRDFEAGREPGQMGTISYMSPEQARGESHLVDGRSDLFSLGIVMYELLTGDRPFTGQNWQAVIVMICYHDPKPPRQRVSVIPKELERICLKLLAKKPNDRYATAADLVEDLNHFLETSTEKSGSVALPRSPRTTDTSWSTQDLVGIIPRGLRSFSREDAMFFRKLLPGPRDRDEIPDSLRFWQQKIESHDPDETFRLGVIYGPSGSGKSSFVKAGLVPILPDRMTVVFIEASVGKTEERLRNRIHGQCPETAGLGLKESLSLIRNSAESASQPEVLIVIDQFEQWLHGWDESPDAELAVALRQCDGDRLRTILLVRDDFWLAVSRFADVVDFELVPGRNLSMIDLFDKRHARRVLAEYGRGHARLPETLQDLTKSQNAFLDEAIDGLTSGEKIVPIQLAAFSEIMKGRDWDTKSLHDLGGVQGVGVRFLEESFTAVGAPANQRSHDAAVQGVLRSLLPSADTNIKGAMRSETELQKAAGYEDQPKRFEQLIQILDTDLRLITPADASHDDAHANATEDDGQQRYYQLTHDFLVPAVRTWLERRQSLTIRGRAAIRLSDRTDVWTARPDNRHLPSWPEWVTLLLFTRRSQRDTDQQRMMNAANRRHVLATLAVVAVASIGVFGLRHVMLQNESSARVHQLLTAESEDVTPIINAVNSSPARTLPIVRRLIDNPDLDHDADIKLKLALLRLTKDPDIFRQLSANLSMDSPELLLVASREMQTIAKAAADLGRLWTAVEDDSLSDDARLAATLQLAAFSPPVNDDATARWTEHSQLIGDSLLSAIIRRPTQMVTILQAIHPARQIVLPQLRREFADPQSDPVRRQWSTIVLRELWQDDVTVLTDVFLDARENQMDDFLPLLDRSTDAAMEICRREIEQEESDTRRLANAAAFLLRHQQPQAVFDLFQRSGEIRPQLIRCLQKLNPNVATLASRLSVEDNSLALSALLLSIGSHPDAKTFAASHPAIYEARELFLQHPSSLVHSSAEWFLKQTGYAQWVNEQNSRLENSGPANSDWNVDRFGQCFVRVKSNERHVEFATTEVTRQQFELFQPHHRTNPQFAPEADCPVNRVSWLMAVQYCRWLTIESGLSEDDQCYDDPNESNGVFLLPDFESRRGYRLPTTAEWEAAAESHSNNLPQQDLTLWLDYGWLFENSNESTHPVATKMPGPGGLFDMVGNVAEWCHRNNQTGPGGSLRPIRSPWYFSDVGRVPRYLTAGRLEVGTRFDYLGFRLVRSVVESAD